MKKITFEIPELKELSMEELQKTTGGVPWISVATTIAILLSAVSNFADIRHGISDGWQGLPPRHLD